MRLLLIFLFLSSTIFTLATELADNSELYEGKEYRSAFADPKDTELPNVLLIGDSISIGYTVHVRKLLKGKADVFRIKGNGKYSAFGLQNVEKWVSPRKYDVIHFNWGLWDLCYRNPKFKTQWHRDKENGKLTATLDEYQKNMKAIVGKLKKTGSKLIWCATTPVPEYELGRIKGASLKYNNVAAEIMKMNAVKVNDLYSHALKKIPAIQLKKGDVHFTEEGYRYLAEKVSSEILKSLP